jgi:hypothetical protein
MQNKRIIYQNETGGVSVLVPCECGLPLTEDESLAFAVEAELLKDAAKRAETADERAKVEASIADFSRRFDDRAARLMTIEEIAAKDVPDRTVFTQTGTAILTQDELDESPGMWDGSGYNVGDQYPTGNYHTSQRPYKIVDVADIPTDRQWRNEWTVDAADLTDGVGA